MRLLLAGLVACGGPVERPEGAQPVPTELTVWEGPQRPNLLSRGLNVAVEPPSPASVTCVADGDGEILAFTSALEAPHHRFTLLGLRAVPYACGVVAGGRRTVLRLEPPVLDLPAASVEGGDGVWTAFVWERDGARSVVVLDDEGQGRMWVDVGASVAGQPRSAGAFVEPAGAELLVSGALSIAPRVLDGSGVVRWWPGPLVRGRGVHHDGVLRGESALLLTWLDGVRSDGRAYRDFGVEELGHGGTSLWSWAAGDTLEPVGGGYDAWHANAVHAVNDEHGPAVWVSIRNTSQVLRVQRSTGLVTHVLGAEGDFDLFAADGAPSEDWFRGQHDPHFLEGGRVVLLDNDWDGTASRILELRLDLEAGEAHVLRQWTEPGWYEPIMGGVREREDGSWFLSRAHWVDGPLDPDARSQFLIVEPDTGDVRWRLTVEESTGILYRGRELDPCALLGVC